MPLPPDPVAFIIPLIDRPVYWYGIMVTLGTLAGAIIADREAKRRGYNPDHVWNALLFMMVFGLLGARLYHVISSPSDGSTSLQTYLKDPISIISFWDGGLRGLGIFGALVGGAFGLWFYCAIYPKWQLFTRRMAARRSTRRRADSAKTSAPPDLDAPLERLSFPVWADICIVGVPLGQAIGRWGNYFNQELYGNATTLPWGLQVSPERLLPRFAGDPATTRYHPTFLYESLWNLLVFFVLSYIAHHWEDRIRTGDLVLIYFILYPLGRYFTEIERPDAWMMAGIPVAQMISVGSIVVASSILLARQLRGRRRRRTYQEIEA